MTTTWMPTIKEVIYESAERARIDPLTVTATMFWSAQRTLNSIFTAWMNDDVKLPWVTSQATLAIPTAGVTSITLPTDCFDLLEVTYRRDGVDTPCHPMSRDEYTAIPIKTTQGRPSKYWVERLGSGPVFHPWLTPENNTDTFRINYIRLPSDIGTDMSVAPDVARRWVDALFDELAKRLYQKFGTTVGSTDVDGPKGRYTYSPQFYALLKSNAAESYQLAKGADRERADLHIGVRFG